MNKAAAALGGEDEIPKPKAAKPSAKIDPASRKKPKPPSASPLQESSIDKVIQKGPEASREDGRGEAPNNRTQEARTAERE